MLPPLEGGVTDMQMCIRDRAWIENMYDADKSKELAEKIIPMVEAAKDTCYIYLYNH